MNDNFITRKLTEYAEYKRANNVNFTLYDLHKDNLDNFWNFCAIFFGYYTREHAEELDIKEFSEGNFEMVEYKKEDDK
tara:strand:- start:170 stop:403 length:234 start_codon:yes stop_codon:yes gene_type:complete